MVTHYNFKECNPHPQRKLVGDCVKRACVIASEINYHDIAIMINRYKKETGARKFNEKRNDQPFISNVLCGYSKGNMQYANNGHRYQVDEYAELVQGKVIAQTAHHLVAMKNGCYYDTWDSGYKSIYRVWEIPSYEMLVNHIRRNYPKLCKGLTLERYRARINLL